MWRGVQELPEAPLPWQVPVPLDRVGVVGVEWILCGKRGVMESQDSGSHQPWASWRVAAVNPRQLPAAS